MENIKELSNKKKIVPIILAAVAILAIIIVIIVASTKKEGDTKPGPKPPVSQSGEMEGDMPVDVDAPAGEDLEGGEEVVAINPALVNASAVVEGANLISTDGKVITNEGEEIKTNVSTMDSSAPRQLTITDAEVIKDNKNVIKIDISSAGYSPSEFTVKKGEPVTIALTATDEWSHGLMFDDPKLSAVAIGISAGETGIMSFNAPNEPGEYSFRCTVLFHDARGEVGKMIVK